MPINDSPNSSSRAGYIRPLARACGERIRIGGAGFGSDINRIIGNGFIHSDSDNEQLGARYSGKICHRLKSQHDFVPACLRPISHLRVPRYPLVFASVFFSDFLPGIGHSKDSDWVFTDLTKVREEVARTSRSRQRNLRVVTDYGPPSSLSASRKQPLRVPLIVEDQIRQLRH